MTPAAASSPTGPDPAAPVPEAVLGRFAGRDLDVDEAVGVVVDPVARDLAGVGPDVRGEVGVVVVHAGVDDGDVDAVPGRSGSTGQAAGYDDQKCYAFLRYQGDERLLVVVNFDRANQSSGTGPSDAVSSAVTT